ncbi:MAG: VanZ family protein [Deltaproteobacteria bacterium]|nr:VanZ family protein [Deltaproteobacteria bacterium]
MNFKYAFLGILITGLIVYMSSIPDKSMWGFGSMGEQIVTNLAHIPAYALLTFLWLNSFAGAEHKPLSIPIMSILACMTLFAISDEIHQSFVPGRSASLIDIVLDLLGILAGLAVFKFLGRLKLFRRREETS